MSGGLTGVPCPKCRKPVAASATRCPHCHSDFTPEEIAGQKRTFKRYLGIGCGGVLAFFVLVGLIAGGESSGGSSPEFITLPGMGNNVMIVPPDMKPEEWPAAAKERCGDQPICQVLAWTDRASAARALPMTDPELAALAFSYSVNRNSGFEQALWDCKRFPRGKPDECLGKE